LRSVLRGSGGHRAQFFDRESHDGLHISPLAGYDAGGTAGVNKENQGTESYSLALVIGERAASRCAPLYHAAFLNTRHPALTLQMFQVRQNFEDGEPVMKR